MTRMGWGLRATVSGSGPGRSVACCDTASVSVESDEASPGTGSRAHALRDCETAERAYARAISRLDQRRFMTVIG